MRASSEIGAMFRSRPKCLWPADWKTASSGRARTGASCASSTAPDAASTSTTRGSCAPIAVRTTLEWITASGAGTVYSFTVIRQNGVPPFNERVPFVVATVDLDEDGAAHDRGDARPRARARAHRHACARDVPPANDELGFVDFAAG